MANMIESLGTSLVDTVDLFVCSCLILLWRSLCSNEIWVICLAAGFISAGAAVQIFLLRKTKRAHWFPILYVRDRSGF